jgi:hypothetical protein
LFCFFCEQLVCAKLLMPQSPPPYCRFKKLSYNHPSQESASPRQ